MIQETKWITLGRGLTAFLKVSVCVLMYAQVFLDDLNTHFIKLQILYTFIFISVW